MIKAKISQKHAKSVTIIKQADEAKEAFLKYYNPKASQKNKLSEENENKAANAYINQKLKIYTEKIEKLKEGKSPSLLLKTMQLYNNLFKIKALFSKYKERTDSFISKNINKDIISKIGLAQLIKDFESHINIESFDEMLRKMHSNKMLQSYELNTRKQFEGKIFASDRLVYGSNFIISHWRFLR
jgi:hypothetical protein